MAEFWVAEEHPGEHLGIRRHTDRCFHEVEEEVEDGYILQGHLVPHHEIAEVRRVTKTLADSPASCRNFQSR